MKKIVESDRSLKSEEYNISRTLTQIHHQVILTLPLLHLTSFLASAPHTHTTQRLVWVLVWQPQPTLPFLIFPTPFSWKKRERERIHAKWIKKNQKPSIVPRVSTALLPFSFSPQLKCSKPTCEVMDVRELIACSACLSTIFDRHYSMINATW